jgi:hypothetical protein
MKAKVVLGFEHCKGKSNPTMCKSKPDNSNISYKDCGHNKMLFPKFRLRQGTSSDYT